MQKERLTPISEVSGASDRVVIRLSLPTWLHGDAIGVHLPRLHRAMSFGGIRSITFRAVSENKSAYVLPASVLSDGSATASAVQSRSRTDDLENILIPGKMPIRNSQWANVNIRVNLEELRTKIDREKGSVRNVEHWANELDTSLRNGLRRSGLKHLFIDFTTTEKGLSFLANCGTGVIGIGLLQSFRERYNLLGTDAFNKALVAQLGTLLLFNAAGVLSEGFERNGKGYRMNFFPGFEIDRALLLLASTRQSKPLIKLIKE